MSIIKNPEFFINQKSIPDQKSVEYTPFFLNELDKITYGLTIDGVYIHGWLYWHINHWHINKDILDSRNGDIIRTFSSPDIRDNEWIIAEHIKMAEDQKKGLMLFGSRRLGKSVAESSWIGRGATIYEGSENVISSTNSFDLSIVTGLIDKGMGALHPFFKHPRIGDNWAKEVVFGFKEKKTGQRHEYSKIAIRNLSEGLRTEAFAGLTPKTLIIDEIGKSKWAEAFESAKPSFTSPFGWRCMPWLSGTGGTLGADTDAERYFTGPDNHNFLSLEIPEKKKRYGLFISGLNRMEGKVQSKFGNYIKRTSGILIPEDSELNTLVFFETDKEKAKAVIKDELDKALKDKDPKAYLKQRMYFPEDPDDCFLTDDENNFPLDALREHLQYLELTQKIGDNINYFTLYRSSSGKIKTIPAKPGFVPINDFPVDKGTIKDAPVVIYEEPMDNPPMGLYIAGADPYNQAQSKNSVSVGTVYVYKRMYDVAGGSFQDTMVASYAARPNTMKEWHETLEFLLEYYNAICMPENEGNTLIQYFDQKNKGHYLADGYSFLKEINPKTSITGRTKGLPATTPVQNFCMNLLYQYCKEDIHIGIKEDGTPLIAMGLVRFKDQVLIREMLAYRKDGNFDRIIAFYHALACNVYFNKIYPVVRVETNEEPVKQHKTMRSPFILKKTNPFK